MSRKKNAAATGALPEVSVSDEGDVRHLHLGTPWIQGSMNLKRPFDLELEYVQRMMAWLLFVEPEAVPDLRAMQLGLGAAALTKFSHKVLGMDTTAIELNPQVIHICRSWFKLPPDGARLRVMEADAGEAIRQPQWQGQVDTLQVDLYDHEAAAPVLDDPGFYAGCRGLLSAQGCMTVNLFGRTSSYARSLAHMTEAFGEEAMWSFSPTREGNTIVLALRTPQTLDAETLAQRAAEVQARWGIPTGRWGRAFRKVQRPDAAAV